MGLGEWGEITVDRAPSGAFRARTRYRGRDGRRRLVERRGRSASAARRALATALQEQGRQSADPNALRSSTTFDTAAEVWMDRMERLVRLQQRSPGTLQTYRRQLEGHVLTRLGGMRLSEVTTPVVDSFIADLHEHVGPATARTCRSIVSGVMSMAVRHGAVAANPTRELERLHHEPKREPRALTEAERQAWFSGLAKDQVAVRQDLPDFSAFLLAAGLRIGEALALQWGEVDLDHGVLNVTSTLIRVTGRGLVRKPTKSRAGQRALLLPSWCVAILRRRAEPDPPPREEPVFASIDGTFRDPRNVTRMLAAARQRLGFGWVTSHSWRKTTATVLDSGGATARMIADQLGHSKVSMTQDVYLGRRTADALVLRALEEVDPRMPTQSDELSDESGPRDDTG